MESVKALMGADYTVSTGCGKRARLVVRTNTHHVSRRRFSALAKATPPIMEVRNAELPARAGVDPVRVVPRYNIRGWRRGPAVAKPDRHYCATLSPALARDKMAVP